MKRINRNAPVKCSKTVIINASSERVWEALTDISNWPAWQTDISKPVLHGDLKPGTTFEWKSGGHTFSQHYIRLNRLVTSDGRAGRWA